MNTQTSLVIPTNFDFHMDLEMEGYLITTVKSKLVIQPSNSTSNLSSVTFTPVFTLPSSRQDQFTGKDVHFSHHFHLVIWKNSVVAICLYSERDRDGERDRDTHRNLEFYKLCTILDNSFDELNQIAGFVVHHNKTVIALLKPRPPYNNDLLDSPSEFIVSHIFNPDMLSDFNNFIYDE